MRKQQCYVIDTNGNARYLYEKDIVMLIKIVLLWKDNQKFKTSWMSQGNSWVFVYNIMLYNNSCHTFFIIYYSKRYCNVVDESLAIFTLLFTLSVYNSKNQSTLIIIFAVAFALFFVHPWSGSYCTLQLHYN